MVNYTYPHLDINVKAGSGGSVDQSQPLPLHLPIFPILAEKGDVNVPVVGTLAEHKARYGARTFDSTGPFYQHPTLFALKAMAYQQVYLLRLVDPKAATAGLVLLATVSKASIPQYETDPVLNTIVKDPTTGLPVTKKDATGADVVEDGFTIQWGVRALAANETFDSVKPTVEGTTDSPTGWVYPILGVAGRTPGSALNRQGFRFYAPSDASSSVETTIKSALYRFEPVTLSAGYAATVSAVTDIFSSKSNDVSLKTTAVNPTDQTEYGMAGMLINGYTKLDGTKLLDYDIHPYSDNVSAIGQKILSVSPELDASTDPFSINLMTGNDLDGNPYHHFTVTADSANVVNSSVILYLQGGSDGDLSKANLESLLSAYLTGTDNLEFCDSFRHPFTHFYDSGYAFTTKQDLSNIFSLRNDVIVTFSTQDIAEAPNTQLEDQSMGAALLSRVRTVPESILYGTGTIRADIYQQCGRLADVSAFTGWVPCTLDRMLKRCAYMSGQIVTGTPKGRPYSEVTIFRELNWTSATVTQRQMNWDTALNTISYAAPEVLYYPDLRSVFPDETDLLSDSVYVDYINVLKRIAQEQWTYFVGVNDPKGKNASAIEKAIDSRSNTVFGGRLITNTYVYQSEANKRNGFTWSVRIEAQGDKPDRIWDVEIDSTELVSTSTTTSA